MLAARVGGPMNLDVEELARYPMESDDWLKTVLIGGGALLFSFLLVPLFLVAGYLVETLRAGMAGAETPPEFDDWGRMLTEGVVASVIGLVYQIVPLAVFLFFVGGSILAFLSGSEAGGGIGLLGLLAGGFLSWLLSIVFAYVGMAGITNYAREGTFGAGFDVGVIGDVATDGSYLLAWVYVIVLQLVVGVVVSVLNAVPVLGSIVGVFVSFYALIIAGWLLGNGFAEATERTPAPDTDAAGDVA
jgi:hypothetical protein